jgi:oxygen-independent coproporphyrinogen-3 oxidase
MRTVVERANERMNEAYRSLPSEYFVGKDASTYLFNNITRVAESAAPLRTPVGEVIRRNTAGSTVSMYFGVPWCEQICSFCNFAYSTSQSAAVHTAYIGRLMRELELFKEHASPDFAVGSVYFGGGTPTILQPELLGSYIRETLDALPLSSKRSVTCEFSTSTIDSDKLAALSANGITRVSTGIQSLDDQVRARANLVGSGADALAAVRLVQDAFDHFNIDLIYGHPYQTDEDWCQTVQAVGELGVPSITLYRLEVKKRTTFKKVYARDEAAFADEMQARRHYFVAREILESFGYIESPLGWWVRKDSLAAAPGWQTHLQNWRKAMPYFGLGQGAFSLIGGAYYVNQTSSPLWQSLVDEGRLPIANVVELTSNDQDLNQLMRLLRVAKSVNLEELFAGGSLENRHADLHRFFSYQMEIGLMRRDGEMHTLTEAGESLIHWMFDDMITALYAHGSN